MTAVNVITTPSLEGKRRAFVLAEDRIGHYPEFRAFFSDMFDLGRIGLQSPGYLAAPSGTEYALVFIGRSGEPFPAGVEIYALVPALEPLDDEAVDRDLWEILRWTISGVGGDWTLADLDATGRLYLVPAAAPGHP
jgi:hypothetical protein